jgi:hypothetical protein
MTTNNQRRVLRAFDDLLWATDIRPHDPIISVVYCLEGTYYKIDTNTMCYLLERVLQIVEDNANKTPKPSEDQLTLF